MASESPPFHMQEIGHDVPVLPKEVSIPDSELSKHCNATYVEVDSDDEDSNKTNYAEYKTSGKGLTSSAHVTEDGRIAVSLDLKRQLPDLHEEYAKDIKEFAVDLKGWKDVPKMNVVIMIVGSRGDVQPYIALGKLLCQDGHRVRIATHDVFGAFVKDAGLEFFNIGGDPHDLMSYMVKNPGLIPGMESLTNGDISRKRKMLTEMINGCWKACICPDPVTNNNFAANAIISNPPAFAHVHCAEALGIPCLLSFTMPWCPTTAFPHPLANIKSSNAEQGLTNYLSYAMTDLLTWQGVGDIINKFRSKTLGLPPLALFSGPGLIDRLKVPWTYCMSPTLVPKPKDWKGHIDIVGFYFLDLATDYKPPDDLASFLDAGPPPVYIGFGSVVIEDSKKMTDTIFSALATDPPTRALVSAGWGGLGGMDVPDHIFILGNVPHDWLFERVAAVVHHGGAGTTAAGLQKGRPTVVVPFFGDQIFWGTMIHKAGAGPAPIPHKKLNSENLREAIQFALSREAKVAAAKMAEGICGENGAQHGLESFYKHLPLLNMRCDLDPSRLAVWWSSEYCMKLSAFSAHILVDSGQLKFDDLDPHRSQEYASMSRVSDPVSGGAGALFWTLTRYAEGVAQLFYDPAKGITTTTVAIPKGIMETVESVHEGLYNLPKLYGSEVRQHGKVTNWKTGLKEGGKEFYYGYYDGITGLIREPVRGAKEEGLVGALKGSGRGLVNVNIRPAAGSFALVVHPVKGVWKSIQKKWAKKQEHSQRMTMITEGEQEVKNSAKTERSHSEVMSDRAKILHKFETMKHSTKERKKRLKEVAERVMFEDMSGHEPEVSSSKSDLRKSNSSLETS